MTDKASIILRKMISVVENWMEYMRLVVRTPKVLAEHSICYPISDFFERNSDITFQLEKKHDKFKKKRVDVFWSLNSSNENFFIELKMASGYSAETLSDYFDDLCRLSLLTNASTHCFFILSGDTEDFLTTFYNTINQPRTNRKCCKWLSLNSNANKSEHTIFASRGKANNKIVTSDKTIDCFDAFITEYQDAYIDANNQSLEASMNNFRTKLIYYNNEHKKLLQSKNSIAIWEILPCQ